MANGLNNERSFRKKLNYTYTDNKWFVILLHEIATSSVAGSFSTTHWCNGNFTLIRGATYPLGVPIRINTRAGYQKEYNKAEMHIYDHSGVVPRLVTCVYEGKTYIAIDYRMTSGISSVIFNGEANVFSSATPDPNSFKVVLYWDSVTSAAIVSDVYNSIKTLEESGYFTTAPNLRIGANALPAEPNKFSLGSATLPWKELHLAPAQWHDLVLQNGFSSSGGIFYAKSGNRVAIRGEVVYASGDLAINTTVTTLPNGYRSIKGHAETVSSANNDGYATLMVYPDGLVQFTRASNRATLKNGVFIDTEFTI